LRNDFAEKPKRTGSKRFYDAATRKMILLLTRQPVAMAPLEKHISGQDAECRIIDLNAKQGYASLFSAGVSAAIIEDDIHHLPVHIVAQINALGRTIPILVLNAELSQHSRSSSPVNVENVTVLKDSKLSTIAATLAMCGVLGKKAIEEVGDELAFYNPHISALLLKSTKALGVLCVDASDLRKIEIENGYDSYSEVRAIFETILLDMRGKRGCLRRTDVICKHPDNHNHYLVFLQPSRMTGALPMPGDIERIADRLSVELQNILWRELTSETNRRNLPECVGRIPTILVGYTSVLDNPCLDAFQLISEAVILSSANVETQQERMRARQRELIQYLIHAQDLLIPHFQAVFHAKDITQTTMRMARESGNLKPLVPHLFGFEALIRVPADRVSAILKSTVPVIEPKLLGPDVLFTLAKSTKISLELDQACLLRAVESGKHLPGNLLINILPRNLYHFDRLIPEARAHGSIILEVSESEPISNLPLVQEALARAASKNVQIAADDFGKDHAGLSRVIDIKPAIIKFDRNLVQNIQLSPAKQAYLKGVIVAAKQLNADVIAEGVETWEELEVLQAMGVDYVQGFLLHRPQALEVILQSLNAETPRSRQEASAIKKAA
jgi:EAL domain-containing protein (putative c-di-GMP-specific phosphodiesterase class I)